MKKILLIIICLVFVTSPQLMAQSGYDIVKKSEDNARGLSSVANITIETIRPKWSRSMTVKTWLKGNDLTLILVKSPAKEKGVVFLKRFKEVWNWVPSIDRNIKMPPSMMSQSWMGTDFTNDDLVKEASILEDYTHTIVGDTIIDDRFCYKIELIPKPSSAIVWGKLLMSIDRNDFLLLHVEYFDEDNTLINTMSSSDIKMFGGRILPSKMEMSLSDKVGHKTVLIYNSLEFDVPMDDSFFTTHNMAKVK